MNNTDKTHILILHQKGYGYKKISSVLGINVNTVKSYLRRLPNSNNPLYKCEECSKPLTQTPHKKPKRFCSDACRSKWWGKHKSRSKQQSSELFTCQFCGKEFWDAITKDRKYCSTDCYWQSRRNLFYEERQESDARTAPCGTELSDLPSDCLCTSCKWFVDGKRACCCKKALTEKI